MNEGVGHKECYGTMLPKVPVEPRMVGSGKVFSFEITDPGGIGPPLRNMKADAAQWDDCCICPEFDSCYKLCMMKAVLSIVVHQE